MYLRVVFYWFSLLRVIFVRRTNEIEIIPYLPSSVVPYIKFKSKVILILSQSISVFKI